MKPPKKIFVGPVAYKVIADEWECDAEAVKHKCGESVYGFVKVEDHTIFYHPHQKDQVRRVTVVHEWLHTETERTGLQDEFGKKKDEKIVRRLAPAIIDTMQRNPDLVCYIMGWEFDRKTGRKS